MEVYSLTRRATTARIREVALGYAAAALALETTSNTSMTRGRIGSEEASFLGSILGLPYERLKEAY